MQILDLSIVEEAGRGIAAFLCKGIYKLIAWLYEAFMTIAKVNLLSSDDIAPIYQRITMILTIVMVFYITFEFVKYVVQPDTIGDKEKGVGNIALKLVLVIVMIAFVPKIFSLGYKLQGRIIDTQFISKIVLGNPDIDDDMGSYGRGFSSDVFSVFYKVNEEACNDCDAVDVVNYNLNRLRENGDLKYLTMGLYESSKIDNPATGKKEEVATIDFDGLFAVVVGGFICYILLLYCVDLGVRYAQLIFLQIVSPIAIMGYLAPKKDNMFAKWGKQCFTTYIDLFIRIVIIYFILLLCQTLNGAFTSGDLFKGLNVSDGIKDFTYIALILGLLLFASRAPKLLEELFPKGGTSGIGFGLKGKDRIAPMAARTAGLAGGSLAGGAVRTAARIKNENRRRKDIKDKLTEEGKPTDRRSLNKAVREAKKAERKAKNEYRNKRKSLEDARDNLVSKQRAYEAALNNDNISTEEKNRLKEEYDKAKNEFDMVKSGGHVSEATRRELADIETQLSRNDISADERARLTAKLKVAQDKYNKEYNSSYDTAKAELNLASSERAKAENQSYGSNIALQGIGAFLQGFSSGAVTGFSASKPEEINKKINESIKNSKTGELSREKWLEEGGGATISATVSKTITKLQQAVGVKTASEIIKQEVKNIEAAVKINEAQASMEKGVKSAQDSSEDRSGKKIEAKEQNIAVANAADAEKLNKDMKNDKNGLGIKVKVGQSTSEIYGMYEAAANSAKAISDAANAELVRAEMNGEATDEMRQIAAQKAQAAVNAEEARGQALKHLKRYGITRALRGDIGNVDVVVSTIDENGNTVETTQRLNEKADAVLNSNINTMRQAIDNARRSTKTVEYLQSVLDPETFTAFINNTITDFDTYDAIQGKLTNHSSQLTNENSGLKETVRAINESSATFAANATAEAASSGGKK